MELAVASGLQVLNTMLEEDRTALCGPRYQHQAERAARRARGRSPSEVVLGGRKVRCAGRASGPTGDEVPAADVSGVRATRPAESSRRRADAHRRRHAAVRAEPGAAPGATSRVARHQQERREPPVRREDRGAAHAWQTAPLEASIWWRCYRRRPHRRALHRRRPRDRHRRAETRAGPLGRVDGECRRLSESPGGSPEPRPADRSQPLGDPRWRRRRSTKR